MQVTFPPAAGTAVHGLQCLQPDRAMRVHAMEEQSPQQQMPLPGGGDQNDARLAQMHQMMMHAVNQMEARVPPPMMAGQTASVGAMQGSPQQMPQVTPQTLQLAQQMAQQMLAQQFGAMQMAGAPMGAVGVPGLQPGQMHLQQMQPMVAMNQMQHAVMQMQDSPMGAYLADLQMERAHSLQLHQPPQGGGGDADGWGGGGSGGWDEGLSMHPRGGQHKQQQRQSTVGWRSGRAGGGQSEEKRQRYYLNLDDVRSGADERTTLMIRNIPNKYTQKMLLEALEQNHRGHFDLLYLPIDFRNKCNVGYAFVNFITTSGIPAFYEEFNFRQWECFNSNKVCEIAYARIQSKAALIRHFENSALSVEDEAYQPFVFASDGSGRRENKPFGPLKRTGHRDRKPSEDQRRNPAQETLAVDDAGIA